MTAVYGDVRGAPGGARAGLPAHGRVAEGSTVVDIALGRHTETDVELGDYSYCDRCCALTNTTVGRFSNIANFVRIGATGHPLDRASLPHFMYRSAKYWPDAEDNADWSAKRRSRTRSSPARRRA